MAIAIILPTGRTAFYDNNGVPLVSGYVYFYIPNTSTPKNTWQDGTQSVLNANPVRLDSLGSALIYGNGKYRMLLKDVDLNTVYDALTSSGPLAGDFMKFDTDNNFTVDNGPNLFADTTNRLVWGLVPFNPSGTTYTMTDVDRGKDIGTDNAAGDFTIILPDTADVGEGYISFFRRDIPNSMIIQSNSSNIYTPVTDTGTSSITLPTPESFIGLISNNGNWRVWTGSGALTNTSGSTLVYSEAQQSIIHNANVARIWDTVLHDVNGFWNVSNPSRLTIPDGVAKVVITGNTRFNVTTGSEGYKFFLFKNGATFIGCPFLETSTNGTSVFPSGGVSSGEIFVVQGDYFEFMVRQSSGGTVLTGNDVAGVNWFSIQITQRN